MEKRLPSSTTKIARGRTTLGRDRAIAVIGKSKTSPLVNSDDSDRATAVQFSIFGTFGDFGNF
jgi:hypothetical protein